MHRDFDPPTDPVLRVLHDRIHELFPFGLGNIWMTMTGDNYHHISTVLGYSLQDFESMIATTRLINGRGVVYKDFTKYLRVMCQTREFHPRDRNGEGKKRNEVWLRFIPPSNSEYECYDHITPYSDQAEMFIKNYFKVLRDVGMQKCTRMTSEMRSIISNSGREKDDSIRKYAPRLVDDEEEEIDDDTNTAEASSCESCGHQGFLKLCFEEQKEIVINFLNANSKDGIFEFTNKNRSKCIWVRYPCAKNSQKEKSIEDHWRHFYKHIMPHNVLMKVLSLLCFSSSVAEYNFKGGRSI